MFCAALAGSITSAKAADSAQVIEQIAIGLQGHYKVGHWTPIRVTLKNTGQSSLTGRLVLTATDVDGLSVRYPDDAQTSIALPNNESIVVWRYVKFGHAEGNLRVELLAEDGVVQSRVITINTDPAQPHSSTSELITTLGKDVGVVEALSQRPRRAKRTTFAFAIDDLAQLPDRPAGLAAIDTLVLPTSRVNWKNAPTAQLAALRTWVQLGGQLILSVGQQGEQVFGPEGALTTLSPGAFERVFTQRRSAALEAFAGATQRLDSEGGANFGYDMTLFTTVRGRIDLAETGQGGEAQPLIINYPVGFGQITLLTCDLDQSPLATWKGRSRLVGRLLAFHQAGETGKSHDKETPLPSQLGYTDLAGQLRTALDQFSGVRLVAFSWIAGLVIAYILLIGPGDYFLLKFGLKRMQLTWLTLPLVSLAFLGLAWWLNTTFKSPTTQINQADVVDIDFDLGLERGTSWTHVYAPHTAAYNFSPTFDPIEVANNTTQPSTFGQAGAVLTWEGLPGVGLGGLDGRPAPTVFDLPYEINPAGVLPANDPAGVTGIPITSAATKSFITQWWRPLDLPETTLVATGDGLVSGEFTYPLDVELESPWLLYGNWLYILPRTLTAGEVVKLNQYSSPRNLLLHLAQKRTIDGKDVITPWNPRSTDTSRILTMMMFHKATGGNAYTGLGNNFQPWLDLSDHLKTGRAILLGRATKRPMQLQSPNQSLAEHYDDSPTFYRIVLPVRAAMTTP